MITKTRARRSDLFEFFGLDKLPKSSDIMKQKLISMAKKKKAKPHWKTKEGRALGHYTCKYSYSYCLKFKKTIKKIAPFWFASSSDQMKQKLVQMAKNKEARPSQKTKEGSSLSSYTKKSSSCYCENFNSKIRKLAPFWFVSKSYHMKQKLIQMAKNKEARPSQKTKEGKALCGYIYKYSNCYCEDFNSKIRKLAPFWFASSSDQMKQKLVQMAKNKEARPQSGTKEGMALSNYTKKHSGSYCEKFDKLIRRLAPVLPYHSSWFRKKRTLVK